ncbi:MAG: malate dehydrogenase [Gammaproteobacteria bacterium]|nr:MAG: malate dehydrogenase [Gammaproteobacteria bacterium]
MPERLKEMALKYHAEPPPGKIAIALTKPCQTQDDLTLAYTPGVAAPVHAIAKDPGAVYRYTAKGNLVAVVTDGSAVLGLGDVGPLAAKPVMEGKGVLFKRFADIDVFDIEIEARTPEAFVEAVAAIAPTFGGINLEDIAAPACFAIEEALIRRLDIPVFHDDQHGTAICIAAALENALAIQGKRLDEVRIVCLGAGAAGIASMRLLLDLGAKKEHIFLIDRQGVIHTGRPDLSPYKRAFAHPTPLRTLREAMEGADVFIGVSGPNLLPPEAVTAMAERPIIFALSNPEPEISPLIAKELRPDSVIATGRSDHPNQVNNVLAFPYVFRGALDVRAKTINTEMKIATARALSALAREPVPKEVLEAYGLEALAFGPDYILPKPFDPRLKERVSGAVAEAARKTGVAGV